MIIKLNWSAPKSSSCIAIGNFDGIHLGHLGILENLSQRANPSDTKLVITFEPHPLTFLQTKASPKRIIDLRTKCELLQAANIDQVNIFNFNETLAKTSADTFIKKLLSELKMKTLVVGADFRFGHQRAGDINLLAKYAKEYNFELINVADISLNNNRVSSKLIRDTLAKNDFAKVNKLLQRQYYFSGRVIQGEKLGRKLGFPTMNIRFNGDLALAGIYITKILIDEKFHVGAMSVGTRPAVGGKQKVIEVFVLDFDENTYGKIVKVFPQKFIRAEENYDSIDKLKLAIQDDVAKCYEFKNQ